MRILVVHGNPNPPSGSSSVAAWVLQSLSRRHAVTLMCHAAPDLAALDAHYGTELRTARLHVEHLPGSALARAVPRLRLLQRASLDRAVRERRVAYDAVFSTDGAADAGVPSFSYIHFPYDNPALTAQGSMRNGRHFALDVLYGVVAAQLFGYRWERAMRARVLTNSKWTAERIRERYGAEAEVLYPPAAGRFVDVPWEQRNNAVITIGRFSGEKRLDFVIEAVERARALGADLALTVVASSWDPAIAAAIRGMTVSRPWVRIVHDIDREALCELLTSHRYGIHAMVNEHFGLAPAEMLRAGCIPLVHGSGGPREIVGEDARFMFNDREDCAQRLAMIASDPALQQSLREALTPLAVRFTPEHFGRALETLLETRT